MEHRRGAGPIEVTHTPTARVHGDVIMHGAARNLRWAAWCVVVLSMPMLAYGFVHDWVDTDRYYWHDYIPDAGAHWLALFSSVQLLLLIGSTLVDARRSPLRRFVLPLWAARIVTASSLAGAANTTLAIVRIREVTFRYWPVEDDPSMTRGPIVMLLGYAVAAAGAVVLWRGFAERQEGGH